MPSLFHPLAAIGGERPGCQLVRKITQRFSRVVYSGAQLRIVQAWGGALRVAEPTVGSFKIKIDAHYQENSVSSTQDILYGFYRAS